MIKKICLALAGLMLGLGLNGPSASGGELEDLFSTVLALKIERKGYMLCKTLTPAQKKVARENMQTAASDKVYKFSDNGLNIVADRATDRVLVIYRQFENMGREQVQDLVGELFMAYEDPTVSAHDKVVYWAWGKKGKFTAEQFDTAKEKKRKLAILATVKLNSEVNILDKTGTDGPDTGNAYYIISSDPLLRFFQDG
ncbi:MAG: hypothetical protein V6Z89_07555 [Desulfobacter sp.]